jgi:probable rRNA maturation factor
MAMSLPADSPHWHPDQEVSQQPDHGLGLSLTVSQAEGDWRDGDALARAIRRVAAALSRHPAGTATQGREATVVLGSDALLRRLNASYRGKDVPTNVLSFPFKPRARADRESERYLGDVVLAAETIAREAAERRLEPVQHVQHLVLHGLLHLIGYDHATEAQAVEMERLETEILTALGLEDPYASGRPSQH